jgi:hypothetical protein
MVFGLAVMVQLGWGGGTAAKLVWTVKKPSKKRNEDTTKK